MMPNYYIHEKLIKMEREARLRQAEQERLLLHLRSGHPGRVQHLIGSLGTCLVRLNTHMKQHVQHGEHAV